MKLVRTWLIPLVALIFICTITSSQPARAIPWGEIQIYMDGKLIPSDSPPYIKPKVNVTMVPVRVISEALGAQVQWSQSLRTATIHNNRTVIRLTAGSNEAQVDGISVSLDASVEVNKGRTMIPIRFVSEQLGIKVNWSQSERIIRLTSTTNDSGEDDKAVDKVADELRGTWISTVFNLDWPTTSSYGKVDQQKKEYTQLLDKLQAMGLNAVFVQVRPSADALYPSKLVPWSSFLTGTSGKDPGYDPLQFMIEETHRRGMQFHAWFNPFRATTGSDISKLSSEHVVNKHPEWLVEFNKRYYINPGIPEARQHIVDAIMEVVDRYDVDGIHLDDYFYPTGETKANPFQDDSTYKKYNNGHFSTKGDWRRDNINIVVQQLGMKIDKSKPNIAYGISPYGVWRNIAQDSTGSNTKASVTAYDSTYADVRKWIKNEWIDYVAPQLYWSMERPEVRYDVLTDWWANEVRATDVKLYIGHSPYKLGTSEVGWDTAQEIVDQLHYNRNIAEVSGSIFFSSKDLIRNPLGLIPLLQSEYNID